MFVPGYCISSREWYPYHKPTSTISLDSYKLYILTSPCPASYGSVVTVTFHPPVSNNFASRRPLAAFGAAVTNPSLIPPVCLMAAPPLCVHIPFSHCPEHAIQWHSPPHPIVPHSCGFVGSLLATVLKAFNTALLLLAEGTFTDYISEVVCFMQTYFIL